MDGKEILERVLSTRILEKYRSQDHCLEKLIGDLENSLSDWKSINNIYIGNKTIRASKIAPVFQARLELMLETSDTTDIDELNNLNELRNATSIFVDYLKSHPDSEILSVIFNCDEYHYRVKCGIFDQKLDIICVMKGGHVPEDLL